MAGWQGWAHASVWPKDTPEPVLDTAVAHWWKPPRGRLCGAGEDYGIRARAEPDAERCGTCSYLVEVKGLDGPRDQRGADTSGSRVRVDRETKAVYVYTAGSGAAVARTQAVHHRVNLDFDADGILVGVEVL